MDTKIKLIEIISGDVKRAEEEVNTFLQSGIQLMQDGIMWFNTYVAIMYREAGVIGMQLHTKLNMINNEIQNAQKKILATLGTIDEISVQIDQFKGTEESKQTLVKSKEQNEAALLTDRLVLAKLITLYKGVKDGSINIEVAFPLGNTDTVTPKAD